jgi:squalene-hopene/tetraprenyl-beta-curcumene cyclase
MRPLSLATVISIVLAVFIMAALSSSASLQAGDTLKPPTEADAIDSFDMGRATLYLDQAAKDWRGFHSCTSCHSTYAYAMARTGTVGEGAPGGETLKTVRDQIRARVLLGDNAPPLFPGPQEQASRQTEAIMSALTLAVYDARTGGRLHADTRTALDKMWQVRGKKWENGGWKEGEGDTLWRWLDFGSGPWGSSREELIGPIVALIATGVAPDGYSGDPAVQQNVKAVHQWIRRNSVPLLHHRMLLLWADAVSPGLLTTEAKAQIIAEVKGRQQADGGWSTPHLYTTAATSASPSDGYGTGFAVFMLRRSGLAATDGAVERGLTWLKQHQRKSGAWHSLTVNPRLHNANQPVPARFPTHFGTAFAVMALRD